MMWPFIFSCLIACTGKLVSTSCSLEFSPPRVVVRFGDSLSANCTSSSDQTEGIGWESPYGGVDLTLGVSSLLFKIDSVPEWDTGPMCYMNSCDGDQCVKVLPVTVYKMPDSVSLKNLRTVEEGQQFAIQCDIVNVAPARNLSVLWHKGKKILSSQTFDESSPSPVSKSSVLTLTAHRDDDGAEIWCEAKLNLWPQEQGPPPVRSEAHTLTVLYPPTFISASDETLDFPAGKSMTLNCNATGNPLPSYHWQFLQAAQETHKNQNENYPVLTRPFEFPGIYTCTASNTQGTVTKNFTVSESPYPPAFIDPLNETLELSAGEKMTLNCNATGNPLPSYHWQFLQAAQETHKNQNENYPVLTRPFKFPGIYTCTASNTQGTVTKYFTVSESPYPPAFIDPLNETLELSAGEKMTLNCNATGNPLPSYHWQFPQAAQETYKNQNENYPVLTQPFKFPGIYTCTASNTQGTVTKYFTVSESPYPPAFINPLNETLELSVGEKMTLNCNATGNPLPSYHWQFPQAAQETYKNQDVNHPIVTRPFEFPGVYTCTASNTQGTVTKYFTVSESPYPPAFINPLNETLELSAGEKMSLNCNATGNPLPSYHWQFPQAAQETYKNQDVNHPIVTRPFEFPGVYTCTASNTQGTVTKYFTVSKPPGIGSGVIAGIAVFVVLVVLLFGALMYYKYALRKR
ncbi:immunoglobulin superfamily member 10 isoform X3 [Oreochromis niloticus]|uniref:immunoglobulin superfamily member 10 isoform X3 n=1 Tax=Oreochromis niloticus TaxID=8128 RepID=UPI000DF15E2A|nr:immunoglobulin superfamily member 10 isoform X3 [Oreochromis niloticus]